VPFTTSVLRAGRFPYVHCHLGVKIFYLFSDFYIGSIDTKLAYEITLTEWLKVPNSRYSLPLQLGFERFQYIGLKLNLVC